jgi:hypothetical protein
MRETWFLSKHRLPNPWDFDKNWVSSPQDTTHPDKYAFLWDDYSMLQKSSPQGGVFLSREFNSILVQSF